MQWCLALKRSSASTNVSVLNLAAVDQDDSPESEESFIGSDGNFSTSELSSSSQAELDEETFSVESQDLTSSSGLTKAKDSITNLKKKSAKINQHVQTLKVCILFSLNYYIFLIKTISVY
ncbi:hypothetical protein FKM82_013318, partial [Ascaphus truei]